MSWFRRSSDNPSFPWIPIESEAQFFNLLGEDNAVIFKHSTRCSLSSVAKSRLERGVEDVTEMSFYYLDVVKYRSISNLIEETLGVRHQTPQLIVLNSGSVVYHASHNSITSDSLSADIS